MPDICLSVLYNNNVTYLIRPIRGRVMSNQPKLLDQVRNSLRQRNYSYRTEKTYIGWIKKYILFHKKRHPSEMGEKEIGEYLTYLAVERKVAPATQNQALNSILYLYKYILRIDLGDIKALRPRSSKHLPVVLTPLEATRILSLLQGQNQLMAKLLYGSGLRISEALRLRVKDLDFDQSQVLVRDSKGNKDRVTMLPQSLQEPLREHLINVRLVYENDQKNNIEGVELPYALSRKYPNAGKE